MNTPPTQSSITSVSLIQDNIYRLTLFPGSEGEVSYPMTWEQLFSLMNQIFEHGSSLPIGELTAGYLVSSIIESSASSGDNVVTYVGTGRA